MRCMLKIEIDTEAGNRAIKDGSMPQALQRVLEMTKPEATYFGSESGDRTAYIFFDFTDTSQIPVLTEPAFSALNAKVRLIPVMNLDELQKGLSQIG